MLFISFMFKPLLVLIASFLLSGCSKKESRDNLPDSTVVTQPVLTGGVVNYWVTNSDQSLLLNKQTTPVYSGGIDNANPVIDIDATVQYQTIDGFGYTLTGGSAYLINRMDIAAKNALMNELFGSSEISIGISYLRISVGASDLNSTVFSYNDLPAGQTDISLSRFSLSQDTTDLIPVLQQVIAIRPNIKILASPWSPPVWMKSNQNSIGGSLLPQYYSTYANYFVRYIQQMQSKGINIDAITIQNEPEHGGNNPSMLMTASEQADFIKNHLGPVFQSNGIKTKIIVWDHNCDNPNYPINILNDPAARKYIDGSAFHLYSGTVSAFAAVHAAHPDKSLYFTEQWTGKNGTFDGDLQWHTQNVIIGTTRNYSKIALEWNLANDPLYGPHTPGGCTECKGAVTIAGSTVARNVSYYIIAHAAKFIPPGSVRISSNETADLSGVAFLTPEGMKVLLLLNKGSKETAFNIRFQGKWVKAVLKPGAVASFVI